MSPENSHIPVLLNEVLSFVPQDPEELCVLDGTFGRGGHSRALSKNARLKKLIVLDRDAEAISSAQALKCELEGKVDMFIAKKNFSHMEEVLKAQHEKGVHFVLLDIGVSSPQLDDDNRGFSFMRSGPLDMRMDDCQNETAESLLKDLSETELANVIFNFGEERASRKIAKAIKGALRCGPISDTLTLANLIESVLPRQGKNHPATRTFQALRIAVNRELEELECALEQLPRILLEGSRVVIISFHSLEDRLVKNAFRDWKKRGWGAPLSDCVRPTDEEVDRNKRSRSARLRAFQWGKRA